MSTPQPAFISFISTIDSHLWRNLIAVVRGSGDSEDRRVLMSDFCYSVAVRCKLMDDIVLPFLRAAGTKRCIIDKAESDSERIGLLLVDVVDIHHRPGTPPSRELLARVQRRLRADALQLWPAARDANADLTALLARLQLAWFHGPASMRAPVLSARH